MKARKIDENRILRILIYYYINIFYLLYPIYKYPICWYIIFTIDMQDFGQLSSKTVAEVLMLEIKMSPGSKVFLVSGYPRNMRDVVEYAEKVSIFI